MKINSAGLVDVTPAQLACVGRFLKTHFGDLSVRVRFADTDPYAQNAIYLTADAYPGGGWVIGAPETHLVVVYAPTGRSYPVLQRTPHGYLGAVRSRIEELVLVLAHEFSHIEQYDTNDWKLW